MTNGLTERQWNWLTDTVHNDMCDNSNDAYMGYKAIQRHAPIKVASVEHMVKELAEFDIIYHGVRLHVTLEPHGGSWHKGRSKISLIEK